MTDDSWLDTVRIARDFGTIRELFPPGITDLRDIPYRWFDAIRMALMFISFDELEKEERPPKHIWLDDEQLGEWFKAVEKRRKEKYSSDGGPGPIEDPVQNAAAANLIAGM